MNLRFIDWIWHVRGRLELSPGQSSDDVFERLGPLLRQPGTSQDRSNGTLIFRKKDQAAQDKMAIYDKGVLDVVRDGDQNVLRYDLTSRALLTCFLAPLLFLGFAGANIALGQYAKQAAKAESKTDEAKKKKQEEEDKKKADVPMNPIDKFLGAPDPEKDDKDKDKKEKSTDAKDKDKDKDSEKDDKKRSPTPSYVFAAIFATLYVAGRILEDRLLRRRFRKRLFG